MNKRAFLEPGSPPDVRARELTEYIAYACLSKSLQAATIESHLSAIKHFHRVTKGIELETVHPVVVHALKGVARCHAEAGTQSRLRRPLSWPMLRAGEKLIPRWGSGGRVLWLALGVAYFFLMRASELFAETTTRLHDTFCVRREDVAFFLGGKQVFWPKWRTADSVELRFRASKGDQFRKGAVVTRSRSPLSTGDSGQEVDAVGLMIELLSHTHTLPPHAPLVTYRSADGRWKWWTQRQATKALREVVALAGVPPQEYALHSLRIGGATHLSAGGASDLVIQREGRWSSDAHKAYVRRHDKDADWVSGVLARTDVDCSRQPGQMTSWGGR